MDEQLTTLLERAGHELADRQPATLASLRPPATTAELTDLESSFGLPLLPEIRDLYQWHNGATGITSALRLADDFVFLSTTQAEAERATMNQVVNDTFTNPQDATRFWRSTWLPIGSSYAGSLLVVDHTQGETYRTVFPVEHANGARRDRGWPNVTAVLNELLHTLTAKT